MLFLTLALAILAVAILAFSGCGKKESAEAQAPQETQAPAANTAVETEAATPTEAVAAHDCAGGCGMTNVPEDQLTEIDGKWYCAGCAKKAADEHEGHGHG
jgi:hypothetical protein